MIRRGHCSIALVAALLLSLARAPCRGDKIDAALVTSIGHSSCLSPAELSSELSQAAMAVKSAPGGALRNGAVVITMCDRRCLDTLLDAFMSAIARNSSSSDFTQASVLQAGRKPPQRWVPARILSRHAENTGISTLTLCISRL